MREIKFRAWDKQNKIMLDNSLNGMNHNSWLLLLQLNTGNVWKKGFFNDDLTERMIVMQYTGLKDKNGKEIYEGDICNVRPHEWLDITKKWHVCEVVWGCEHAWNFREHIGKDYQGIRFVEAQEIEIIGNIYENPELLNRHC